MSNTRWLITEDAPKMGGVRAFRVQKGYDVAIVETWGSDVFCQECPAPLAHELQSCRHALAVKRALASGRIALAASPISAAPTTPGGTP